MRYSSPIAYFCAEYGIGGDESLYAGGLGILAADTLFEAADQGVAVFAVGLKYAKTKTVENGFEPVTDAQKVPITVLVPIGKRTVTLRAWVKRIGKTVRLYLLDADTAENSAEDRAIGEVYDPRFRTRLTQHILIGIGGTRLLAAIGVTDALYHINEGNMAFAALALLAEGGTRDEQAEARAERARARIVSTKHTILASGAKIALAELWQYVGTYCTSYGITKEMLMRFGRDNGTADIFSATKFLLQLSRKVNGVSMLHTAFERQKHPHSDLVAITNGVYAKRWQSPAWDTAPEAKSDVELWAIKNQLRAALVNQVNALAGSALDPDTCTVVWTRRFVAYKQPFALFENTDTLAALINDAAQPVQFIISGRVYGTDSESASIAKKIKSLAANVAFGGRVAFVPDYSIELAKLFVSGADVWLNTPVRGIEACGTSGMKAGLNGALMASVSDGWIGEVDWNGLGWILPDDEMLGATLYQTIAQSMLPLFYSRNGRNVPTQWVARMKGTIATIASRYTTKQMLENYSKKMYAPTQ